MIVRIYGMSRKKKKKKETVFVIKVGAPCVCSSDSPEGQSQDKNGQGRTDIETNRQYLDQYYFFFADIFLAFENSWASTRRPS